MSPSDDRLLDVDEAAAFLGVKASTLYAWSHQRRLPVVKLGRNVLRFRLSELNKLVREHTRPALKRESIVPMD